MPRKPKNFATKVSLQQHAKKAPPNRGTDTPKANSFATKRLLQQHARKAPQDQGMDTPKANKLRHEVVCEFTSTGAVAVLSPFLPLPWVLVGLQTAGARQIGYRIGPNNRRP